MANAVGRAKGRLAIVLLLTMMVVYCGSYLLLSRQGFRAADQMNAEGFWFVQPRTKQGPWRFWLNEAGRIVYWPLVTLDRSLGTGHPPAGWPMEGLSARETHAADEFVGQGPSLSKPVGHRPWDENAKSATKPQRGDLSAPRWGFCIWVGDGSRGVAPGLVSAPLRG